MFVGSFQGDRGHPHADVHVEKQAETQPAQRLLHQNVQGLHQVRINALPRLHHLQAVHAVQGTEEEPHQGRPYQVLYILFENYQR